MGKRRKRKEKSAREGEFENRGAFEESSVRVRETRGGIKRMKGCD